MNSTWTLECHEMSVKSFKKSWKVMKKSLKIIKSHKIEQQWDNGGDESDKHV